MRISENVTALSAMNQQLKATQNTAGLSQSAQKLASGTKLETGIGSLKNSFLDSSMLESQQSVSQRAAENMGVKPIYKAVIEELTAVNTEISSPISSVKPIYAARVIEIMEGGSGSIANTLSKAAQQISTANFRIFNSKSVMDNNDRLLPGPNPDRERMMNLNEPFKDPADYLANGGQFETLAKPTIQGEGLDFADRPNDATSIYRGKRGNSISLSVIAPGDALLQGATNVLQLLR